MIKVVSVNDIPVRNIRYLDIVKDIEDFLATNNDAAEVLFPEGRNVAAVVAAYKKQILGKNYQVRVIQRKGQVFLLRKDVEI